MAITGAGCPATVDGDTVEHDTAIDLQDGQTLTLRTPTSGLRSYLAVRGGTRCAGGSRVAEHRHFGRARTGCRCVRATLWLWGARPPTTRWRPDRLAAPSGVLTLRAMLGPRDDWFLAPTDLGVGDWLVSPRSNRVGLRLDRPAPAEGRNGAHQHRPPELRRKDSRELPSEGVVLGAVQVPPSGQPVLFLADHPVTGGYPVIAVVLDNDIDLAAQARPGQRLRFRLEPAPGHAEPGSRTRASDVQDSRSRHPPQQDPPDQEANNMFDSLLVANRGEIARRIIRTAKRMGIRTVAVYSDADAELPFVAEADEAVLIGPADPAAVLPQRRRGAGRGEADRRRRRSTPATDSSPRTPAFARAVVDAGLIWVGPSPAAITAMGDKIAARNLMAAAGVPVAPGTERAGRRRRTRRCRGRRDRLPGHHQGLRRRRRDGHGGRQRRRGHARRVHQDHRLRASGSSVTARCSWRGTSRGSGTSRCRSSGWPTAPCSPWGSGTARCSGATRRSPRRPRPRLWTNRPRQRMLDAARRAGEAVGYRGAGTVEFLFSPAIGETPPSSSSWR